ncbi:hypothetical protein H0H92_009440 [Tricholoma furcatifolium]|nr:hypothetical protein H0H92_009440 [Tricholoma furcatifolium]
MSYPLSLPTDGPLITLTHPKPSLWIIELLNPPDSRLTLDLVDRGMKPALDAVERDWRQQWRASQQTKDKTGGKGALIIVGQRGQDKFFSNGSFQDILLFVSDWTSYPKFLDLTLKDFVRAQSPSIHSWRDF